MTDQTREFFIFVFLEKKKNRGQHLQCLYCYSISPLWKLYLYEYIPKINVSLPIIIPCIS